MKVALVHDYLNQFGGQERVLLNLMDMFPDAPIYTLLYDPDILGEYFKDREIHTSAFDNKLIRNNHKLFIPLLGHAAQTINLKDEYDLIISNTMGFAKGVRYSKGTHISYVHTPLRYAWEPNEFLNDLFPKPLIWAGTPAIQYVRWQDKRFSKRPDKLLANSQYIADKVKRFYNRDATVLHPPIEDHLFYFDPKIEKEDYFLAYGRMIHFKKFPLVARVFKTLGLPLKIVGSGPDQKYIQSLAKRTKNIEVIPHIKDDNELRKVISKARATVVPQLEDFGLVTAESIACGTPVIGYNQGGTVEIIENGVNGVLFNEQTEGSVAQAVQEFTEQDFDPKKVSLTSHKFHKESFKENLKEIINSTVGEPLL